jgi:hypothetical protein
MAENPASVQFWGSDPVIGNLISELQKTNRKLDELIAAVSVGQGTIRDPASGSGVRVDDLGRIESVIAAYPAMLRESVLFPFSSFLKNSSDSSDMQVSASIASPQDFFVSADDEDDLYITKLTVTIADANAVLNKFGNITALTNGCQLLFRRENGELITLFDGLKSNFDFVRAGSITPAIGADATAFRAKNVVGTAEGYVSRFEFQTPVSIGLPMIKGTRQKIILRVRDDTTGVDQFDAYATGFTRRRDGVS